MTRKALLLTLMFVLTGCGAIKRSLRPWVCECGEGEVAQCVAEDRDGRAAANGDDPIIEVRRRDGDSGRSGSEDDAPREDELEELDPRVADAVVSDDARDDIESAFSVGADDLAGRTLFKGNFARQTGEELALVKPGEELVLRGERKQIDRTALAGPVHAHDLEELGIEAAAAVHLVRDGALEIFVYEASAADEARVVYTANLYKVIGGNLARVFSVPVAEKTAQGLRRLAKVAFLRGRDHRAVRVTPYDAEGLADLQAIEIYHWNRWEGMFRIPKPPPTAPNRS